jgi:hypothetical protein
MQICPKSFILIQGENEQGGNKYENKTNYIFIDKYNTPRPNWLSVI